MKQKIINFRDPVVERVVDKFVGRSDVGTTHREVV